ncbi:MAG: hypothetical protein WCE30_06035 [Mycobacterium sp.]
MQRLAPIIIGSAAALLLSSCGSTQSTPTASGITTSSTPESTTPDTSSPGPKPIPLIPLPPTMFRQAKWVDLEVGDCLVGPPPSDPSVVEVQLTDCQVPHAAEVFLRTNVAVNDAIAGVADGRCAAGLAQYTHQHGRYTSTYLIDSNMDRTGYTTLPSTVICVLQAANGQQLSGSARS